MMRKLDLELALGNDPMFQFSIKDRMHRPVNISNATIECYVKGQASDPDDGAVLYQGHPLRPASAGRCVVQMRAADVGGSDKQVYHLDVVIEGLRTTYYFGTLKKRSV